MAECAPMAMPAEVISRTSLQLGVAARFADEEHGGRNAEAGQQGKRVIQEVAMAVVKGQRQGTGGDAGLRDRLDVPPKRSRAGGEQRS